CHKFTAAGVFLLGGADQLRSSRQASYMKIIDESHTAFTAILSFILVLQAVFGMPLSAFGFHQEQRSLSSAERSVISAIDRDEIRRITTELTSDKYQGRGAAQTGGTEAARYIAYRFQ